MKTIRLDVAKFERDGFGIVRNAIDPERIRAALDEWEQFEATDTSSDLPKTEPVAVFWKHVPGQRKRTRPLSEFPALQDLALDPTLADVARQVNRHRGHPGDEELRLMETIVFNKPPQSSPELKWHQDNSFFPFTPNNQAALWIPFDVVDEENGTLCYVAGTHKLGMRASTDLHSGKTFDGDKRPPIPSDPGKEGHRLEVMNLNPGDLVLHDGLTWHCSLANVSKDRPRRALSLRYLMGATQYTPNSGTAATFVEQLDIAPGQLVAAPAFPLIPALSAKRCAS